EIDSSPPAKQTASCPKCYALHAVHADRIITITKDTFDLGPPPVPCEEKERLLAAHNKAVNIYSSGALELAQAAGVVAHAKFKFLYDKVPNRKAVFTRNSTAVECAYRCARLLMAI